jgi:amino acid transporter
LFTLSASIALLVVSVVNSEISQAKGLTGFLMFMAVLISLIAVAAIIMSWKKLKWYLKIYQYTCLIALVLLIIILIGIALMNLNRYSDSGQASRVLNDCNSPRSYFEYQMLDITTSAANMLCSPTCPCPQSTKIQQCS